jgi:hypothetical protein
MRRATNQFAVHLVAKLLEVALITHEVYLYHLYLFLFTAFSSAHGKRAENSGPNPPHKLV